MVIILEWNHHVQAATASLPFVFCINFVYINVKIYYCELSPHCEFNQHTEIAYSIWWSIKVLKRKSLAKCIKECVLTYTSVNAFVNNKLVEIHHSKFKHCNQYCDFEID